jgi:NADPH:quinone reductase-like Zn-dependent oxidoreductase
MPYDLKNRLVIGVASRAVCDLVASDAVFQSQETGDMSIPVWEVLGKNLTIRGYQLFEVTQEPERLSRAKAFITKGLEAGALHPLIAKTFPLAQIVEAHQYMESNTQIGKIVIEV